MATKVILKNVRMSYVTLLEPKTTPDGSEEKYSVSCLIEPDSEQLPAIKKAILDELKSKFGPKAGAQLGKKYRDPLRSGDADRSEDAAYAGKLFMNASSKRRPQVVDRQVMPILDEDEVYSGCYANVSVSLFPYDKAGNKGVGVGLNNVQVVKKGERLGGAQSAEEEFETIEGEDDEQLD